MIEKGWEWQAVPHAVDGLFPEFAKLAQRALNVANHASQDMGELETGVLLADIAANIGDDKAANWKSLAVESVRSMGVPCAHYASVILEFVCTYGGGADAPQVRFMNDVAIQFQRNVILGETFWTTLTNTPFSDKTSKFPFLRVALGLANLTSEKKEDGIAKLITKTDIVKLSSKGKQGVATECEQLLKDAWDIVYATSSLEVAMQPLGQLFVRTALLATEKGKLGSENKGHTVQEVKAGFIGALSSLLGHTIELPSWTTEKPTTTSGPSEEAPMKQITASVSDHSNPVWVAEQAGFVVGKMSWRSTSNPARYLLFFQSIPRSCYNK